MFYNDGNEYFLSIKFNNNYHIYLNLYDIEKKGKGMS